MSDVSIAQVARQPVLDSQLDIAFYKLLHKSEIADGEGEHANAELFSSELMVNALIEVGLDRLAENRRAFVRLSNDYLQDEWPFPIKPGAFGVELSPHECHEPGLMGALAGLREKGLMIALDDFVYEYREDPRLEVADVITMDIAKWDRDDLVDQAELFKSHRQSLLAKNVQSVAEFNFCRELGFDFYQGYFFAKPELFTAKGMRADKLATLQLLAEIQDPTIGLDRLEEMVSQDVALSYRLMRYLHSAYFTLTKELRTIRQALVYLGLRQVQTWASLMIVVDAEDRPHALKQLALTRARFCQALAERLGIEDTGTFFTAGLFSTIDALLGIDMDEALYRLPLDHEIKEALMLRSGRVGRVLGFTLEHERGVWGHFHNDMPLSSAAVNDAYLQAIEWSQKLLGEPH